MRKRNRLETRPGPAEARPGGLKHSRCPEGDRLFRVYEVHMTSELETKHDQEEPEALALTEHLAAGLARWIKAQVWREREGARLSGAEVSAEKRP